MASVVVVATGAVLAVSIPFIALKELIENRVKSNMKKHLNRRGKSCRVNFGNVDLLHAVEYSKITGRKKDEQPNQSIIHNNYSSDDDDFSSISSAPPMYEDVIHLPSYNASIK